MIFCRIEKQHNCILNVKDFCTEGAAPKDESLFSHLAGKKNLGVKAQQNSFTETPDTSTFRPTEFSVTLLLSSAGWLACFDLKVGSPAQAFAAVVIYLHWPSGGNKTPSLQLWLAERPAQYITSQTAQTY